MTRRATVTLSWIVLATIGAPGCAADAPACVTTLDCDHGFRCMERACISEDDPRLRDGAVVGEGDGGGGGSDGGAGGGLDGGGGGGGSDGGGGGGSDGGGGGSDGSSPTCGAYGQVCCAGAAPCRSGGCVDGRCAAFGGAYQIDVDTGGCTTGNPLNAGACSCASGFMEQRVYDADASIGLLYELVVCGPSVVDPAHDFHGGWGRRLAFPSGCTENVTPNRLTSAGTCPGGARSRSMGSIHYAPGSAPDCWRELTLCEGPGASETYGGAFRQIVSTEFVCSELELEPEEMCEPNALTADCICPVGFSEAHYPMLIPHPHRAGTFCDGILAVCVPTP